MGSGYGFERRFVAHWRRSGPALAEVRRQELRGLTDSEALSTANELLDLLSVVTPRESRSGLVEQQRLFQLGRV